MEEPTDITCFTSESSKSHLDVNNKSILTKSQIDGLSACSSPQEQVPKRNFGYNFSKCSVIVSCLFTGCLLVASMFSNRDSSNFPLFFPGDTDSSMPHSNLRIPLIVERKGLVELPFAARFLLDSDKPIGQKSYENENYEECQCGVNCCRRRMEKSNFEWIQSVPFALQMFLIVTLIMFSALFSGLTLGLMSLDTTSLEIVMSGDDPISAANAAKIYPLRKNGNHLLCTLLLGNVAVNTLLGILMADIAGGYVGFVTSTAVIVIFGEICPQAYLSRYALQAGSKSIPTVKVITFILYPLVKPMAFCLDKILGHEMGTTYSKSEMNKLLEIHVKEGRFNQETGTAMAGALKYQDMTVKEVMTPLQHTFMLNYDERLNFETIARIFKTGYSRIPVYEVSVSNIIGLLFVKDLIFIDPEDETPLRNFIQIFGRGVHVVWPDDKLGDVLRDLKKGHSHMALVRDVNNEDEAQDPFYEIKGIITLEDIIEVILGEEIVDETDAWVDAEHSIKVNRTTDFDWARLRLLDAKIVDQNLSDDEVRAIVAHLRTNHYEAVSQISDKQLNRMVAATAVTEIPIATKEAGDILPSSSNLLYEKNVRNNKCTLILGGKINIIAGADNFQSVVSSWSVLASKALTDDNYAPDFSAYVSGGPCRCLCLKREIFSAAVDASSLEIVPTEEDHNLKHDVYSMPLQYEQEGTISHDDIRCKKSSNERDEKNITAKMPNLILQEDEKNALIKLNVESLHEKICEKSDSTNSVRYSVRKKRSKLLDAFIKKIKKK